MWNRVIFTRSYNWHKKSGKKRVSPSMPIRPCLAERRISPRWMEFCLWEFNRDFKEKASNPRYWEKSTNSKKDGPRTLLKSMAELTNTRFHRSLEPPRMQSAWGAQS